MINAYSSEEDSDEAFNKQDGEPENDPKSPRKKRNAGESIELS